MDLSLIKQIVQAEMCDKRSSPYNERGDKYTHGERVAILGVRLHQLIFPNENTYDDVLTVAAWFHDVRNGMDNHAMRGVERTRELLSGHCTAAELDEICGIIAVHDDRNAKGGGYSNTIRLHQDADLLDHYGTFDIWRLVTYTAGHNETINDALRYLQNKWPDDMAKWRDELNFDLSKKIFDDKSIFVQSFIERFAVEVSGGIWNEEALLTCEAKKHHAK
jgi:uncharacterized protein